jgi:hypothetical protein
LGVVGRKISVDANGIKTPHLPFHYYSKILRRSALLK